MKPKPESEKTDFKPTLKEIKNWLLSTIRHSCLVEYYLHKLNWGNNDDERPHDIIGDGNKFSWPVLKGLSIQDRSEDPEFFIKHILPSIELHRQQYHHQKWNLPSLHDNPEDMEIGAIDAICSLLGYRKYQGGTHTLKEIPEIIKKNQSERINLLWTLEPERARWMWRAYLHMKKIPMPNVKAIKSLKNIPNIGIPKKTHEKIISRLDETIKILKKQGYDL